MIEPVVIVSLPEKLPTDLAEVYAEVQRVRSESGAPPLEVVVIFDPGRTLHVIALDSRLGEEFVVRNWDALTREMAK